MVSTIFTNKASTRKAGVIFMQQFFDYTNQKFGYLTVLELDKSFKGQGRKWICKCECGNIKSISTSALNNGHAKSCGCHSHDGKKGVNKTHGMSQTRIYSEWISMKKRCKPNQKESKTYYDRGISVCDEWLNDFVNFYQWAMEHGYNDSLSIDRIDNDKGYYPDNCRWIPIEKQQGNKSNTIYVFYKGEKYCLRQLCQKINFPYQTAHRRYSKWTKANKVFNVDDLFQPIHTEKIAFKYRK